MGAVIKTSQRQEEKEKMCGLRTDKGKNDETEEW